MIIMTQKLLTDRPKSITKHSGNIHKSCLYMHKLTMAHMSLCATDRGGSSKYSLSAGLQQRFRSIVSEDTAIGTTDPAKTHRRNNVVSTSPLTTSAATSKRRYYEVVCLLGRA